MFRKYSWRKYTRKKYVHNKLRHGVTLIEVLIVLGILTLMIGLLLPAIQGVRTQAMKISATNGIKQTLLATHHFADAQGGHLPSVDGNPDPNVGSISLVSALCPYLEADRYHPPALIRFKSDPSRNVVLNVPPPLPPPGGGASFEPELQQTVTSLAFNPLVCSKGMQLSSSIPDGTSTTILITEHYGLCEEGRFDWRQIQNTCFELPSMQVTPCSSSSLRRATFADGKMFHDAIPVTTVGPNGAVSTNSLPLTFQIRPPSASVTHASRNRLCPAESFAASRTVACASSAKASANPRSGVRSPRIKERWCRWTESLLDKPG